MIAIYNEQTGEVRGLQSWPVEIPAVVDEDGVITEAAKPLPVPHWTPTATEQAAIESAVANRERIYYLGGVLVTETDLVDKTVENKAVRALTAAEITQRNNAIADEKRRAEYPPIPEQLDMIYWDQVNNATHWRDTVSAVKAKYPKA